MHWNLGHSPIPYSMSQNVMSTYVHMSRTCHVCHVCHVDFTAQVNQVNQVCILFGGFDMSQKQLRKLRELRKAPEDPPENQQDGGIQWAQGRRLESRQMDLGSGGIRAFLYFLMDFLACKSCNATQSRGVSDQGGLNFVANVSVLGQRSLRRVG